MNHVDFRDKRILLLMVLGGFFVCNALVAEFIGIKIFSLEKLLGISPASISLFGSSGLGFNLTAGVLLWPIVFVMTDIINEYFGPRIVKRLSYFTIVLILYAFLMVYGAIALPPNEWWMQESGQLQDPKILDMNAAFGKVMGQGLWIIIGSMVAFLIGQILDAVTFNKIRKVTGEGKLWLRATGSTLVSQFIDSFVVLIVAFYIGSDWELGRVLAIGLINYLYKFVVAILLTPFIYLAHNIIDNWLGEPFATELKDAASQ